MLWGAHVGSLELRSEGGETRLRAIFPYGRETVLAERVGMGRERREMIAARAFADRIERGEDVHFLSGHDFNKPLASRSAGTLTLTESDDALTVEATISADMGQVSYVRDFLSAHAAGLVRGLSPGFRVRPGGAGWSSSLRPCTGLAKNSASKSAHRKACVASPSSWRLPR